MPSGTPAAPLQRDRGLAGPGSPGGNMGSTWGFQWGEAPRRVPARWPDRASALGRAKAIEDLLRRATRAKALPERVQPIFPYNKNAIRSP